MGSPAFAVPAMDALWRAGHEIAAVYCQPPRPAGRGHSVRPCPVQVRAEQLGLPVRSPIKLRTNPEALEAFTSLKPDVAVVAAYGLILPEAMLSEPRLGCMNIHASLLPRWRGAAPIQAAILAGDAETGITIMQMDAGLDTGPMLLQQPVPISDTTTSAVLHDQLATLGAELIVQALKTIPPPRPQPTDGVTYAPKLTRDDAKIDWTRPASQIDRQVRAFNPWPGTFTILSGTPLKVLSAALATGAGSPGTILDNALTVACGEDAIRLTRLQLPGRSPLDASAFLRGHPVPPGIVLG
jgi:methionyl-tRNA formyltransferase